MAARSEEEREVYARQQTEMVLRGAKDQYYKKYNLSYGQLTLSDAGSPFIARVRELHQTMSKRVEGIRTDKVVDTLIFDHLVEDLQTGLKMLCQVGPEELMTKGDNATNRRTFDDLRRMCNIPTTRPAAGRAEVHFR